MEANKGESMTFLIFGLGILVGMVIVTVFYQGRRDNASLQFERVIDKVTQVNEAMLKSFDNSAANSQAAVIEAVERKLETRLAEQKEILDRIEAKPAPSSAFKLPDTINFNVTERRTIHSRTVAPPRPLPTPPSLTTPASAMPPQKSILNKVKKQMKELNQ